MKIRWNINEDQNKIKEEKKNSTENKFTSAFKSFIPQDANKQQATESKPFPLYERQKRTLG